jgi:signal peptidase
VLAKLGMNLAMVALFCIAGIMLVPAVMGFHRYVILTGSMTGTYDAGSIVFDRPIPTSELKVGDPITYAPPPGASPNHKLVTHRIYRVATGPDGRRVYQTKGDANPVADNWKFMLPQPTQDKVYFHIPYVGYAFELLSVPQFRKIVIGVPAILMALWMVVGMWKEGGEAKRLREQGIAPWDEDVGRTLPQLAPLLDGDPAAGRIAVRVAMTWPAPGRGRRRGELPVAPAAPVRTPAAAPVAPARFAVPAHRAEILGGRGRVALPGACVARARGRRTTQARRLPEDWRLVVRPQTG